MAASSAVSTPVVPINLPRSSREYRPAPRVVRVTPALATELLNANRRNRPLREGLVERYARDMRAGRWLLNGETIKRTTDGDLLDGQHRLYAVIEADVDVDMLFVEGLDPDVMPTIDTGAPRKFGDVLGIRGEKNTSVAASMLRWLTWHQANPRPARVPAYTHSELDEAYEANPDVAERASEVNSSKARKIMPPSILGFVYALAHRIDADRAKQWLELLGSGAGMSEGHPIFQLRERLLVNRGAKRKMPDIDIAAVAIKSWNNFVLSREARVLSWRVTEGFPTIVGSDDPPRVRRRKGGSR